ncbi:MAG: GTPase Era [Flavobacteriaceae bacterium]|nr:GTPase Era [Flavobacteriaceae bacterium]
MKTDSTHKSGFVTIIGKPNVGKSTLINRFLKQPLSIISPKKQTTRHRILGILNDDAYQIIFSDTPGLISPEYKLHEHMMSFTKEVLEDSDVLVLVISCGDLEEHKSLFLEKLQKITVPLLLVINKIDLSNQKELETIMNQCEKILPNAKVYPISALNGIHIDELLNIIIDLLPLSPPYFPKDQLTDRSERFFVNEIIRKNILNHYQKEIPYAAEVKTHQFEKESRLIRIHSDIYVERESQKGILIGHQGQALKTLGMSSRRELESFFEKKIFLKLRIKVAKNWRKDSKMLKRFGYTS